MRFIRSAVMATVAKKVYDEARKPHNQEKIKQFISNFTDKNKGGSGGSGGTNRSGGGSFGSGQH